MINRHLIDLAISLKGIDDKAPALQLWGKRTAAALMTGSKLLVCGTDAGTGQARHIEQTLAAARENLPVLAVLVSDAGADSGSGQGMPGASIVREQGERGDILLCLANGEAGREQMTEVIREARELGLRTFALTGPAPDPVADACAEAVTVSAREASTVEEVHLAAIHIFCAAVISELRDPTAGRATRAARAANADLCTA